MFGLTIILMLLALAATPLASQEGPYVPCVGCEVSDRLPYPELGHWYNPEQSGTGFTLEFQNGVMAGYYFGYDAQGDPEWYLVTASLERGATPGVLWELSVEPLRYTGGNCLGCPYAPPNAPASLTAIKLEFLQRAYARLTLSDGSVQYLVPLMYGDEGKAFFAEQTPYLLPVIKPNPWGSLWTLVFKEFSDEEFAPWTWVSGVFEISEGVILTGGPDAGKLRYRVWELTNPPEVIVPFARIYCAPDPESGEPGCTFIASGLNPVDPVEFRISMGNFTDSRFFGITEEGHTIEGFRLQYD